MLPIFQIFFSLLCMSSALFASGSPMKSKELKFTVEPLNLAEASEEKKEQIRSELKEQSATPEETKTFSESQIEEMEMVFKSSPQKAQNIVEYLQDPNQFTTNNRAAYFVGETGTGKTAMAKAIAYKMAQEGWGCTFLLSTTLLGEYRNQTAIQLRDELAKIESSNVPTVLIIDELHKLFQSGHHTYDDAEMTSAVLSLFLDKNRHNKNLFLIGTLNSANELPESFKARIFHDCVKFPELSDPAMQKNRLYQHFLAAGVQLAPEVTDDFLCRELAKLGSCSGRQLLQISAFICRTQKMNGQNTSPQLVIEKSSIEKAIDEIVLRKKAIGI